MALALGAWRPGPLALGPLALAFGLPLAKALLLALVFGFLALAEEPWLLALAFGIILRLITGIRFARSICVSSCTVAAEKSCGFVPCIL